MYHQPVTVLLPVHVRRVSRDCHERAIEPSGGTGSQRVTLFPDHVLLNAVVLFRQGFPGPLGYPPGRAGGRGEDLGRRDPDQEPPQDEDSSPCRRKAPAQKRRSRIRFRLADQNDNADVRLSASTGLGEAGIGAGTEKDCQPAENVWTRTHMMDYLLDC